jgi:uncharacterized protein
MGTTMACAEGSPDCSVFPAPIQGDGLTRPFWRALSEKRLYLQFDEEAQRFQFYPRPVSLFGRANPLTWREVSGRGFIAAVTLVQPRPPAPAYHLAVIDLEEGARIMAPLVEIGEDEARVGTAVNICWTADQHLFAFSSVRP